MTVSETRVASAPGLASTALAALATVREKY